MASWMVHLRVADRLLDCLEGISQKEFVVGNIAPDSGVPNEDWTAYFPDKNTSHFKTARADGKAFIDIDRFAEKYFTTEQQRRYTNEEYSFFLGYLTHLLTDVEWTERIYAPGIKKFSEEHQEDKQSCIWKLKEDWYDQDFLYLKKHPDFRAFCIYEAAEGFENRYMDIFSKDALDNRRQYITGWYRGGKDNLEREYLYLTEEQAGQFVEDAVAAIVEKLRKYRKEIT